MTTRTAPRKMQPWHRHQDAVDDVAWDDETAAWTPEVAAAVTAKPAVFGGTPKQEGFLRRLFAERGVSAEDIEGALAALDSVRSASAAIDVLLKSKPARQAPTPLPEVPAGYYALDSVEGRNEVVFYKVDRPTEGRWTGYIFVKRVIGGRPESNVPRGQTAGILRRIAEVGPEAAARRFGQEIGRCGRCGRHLTDDESRAAGIGPVCRDLGW